jgi:hypothetical protein
MPVQHLDARVRKPLELGLALLDPVERVADIESAECDVAGPEGIRRASRGASSEPRKPKDVAAAASLRFVRLSR